MNVWFERQALGLLERIVLFTQIPVRKRPGQTSVYRIGDTLIDTGSSRAAPILIDALRDRPPRRVVLTHQHEDHFGGAAALKRAFGDLPVFVPRAHLDIVRAGAPVPPYRELLWAHPEPVEAEPYDPGTVFDTGPLALEAVLTPGHTPGHITLVGRHAGDVYAVSGDLYVTPEPRAAWYESAADDLVRSLRGLAAEGTALRMLPTHGRMRADGAAAMTDLADWIERQSERVLRVKDERATSDLRTIANAVFGEEVDPLERYSLGEFSRLAFVRSVLDPVRTLPATVPR